MNNLSYQQDNNTNNSISYPTFQNENLPNPNYSKNPYLNPQNEIYYKNFRNEEKCSNPNFENLQKNEEKRNFENEEKNIENKKKFKFSSEFIKKISNDIFDKHDFNKSGYLGVRAIYPAVCEICEINNLKKFDFDQVMEIMRIFDEEGNGLIDKKEFQNLILTLSF